MIKSYAGTYILSYQYSKVTVLYVFIEPVTCHCILYFVQSETAMARKTLDLIDSYDAIIVATAQHIYQGYGIFEPTACSSVLGLFSAAMRWTFDNCDSQT